MSSGFNNVNDVSVTGLVSIKADTVSSGVIMADALIIDGTNIFDLIDQLENEIDTNAQNIATLQAQMLTKAGLSSNNVFTGTNNFEACFFNGNVEFKGNSMSTVSNTQTSLYNTNINGNLTVSGDDIIFQSSNPPQFQYVLPISTVTPTSSNELCNKSYVDTKTTLSAVQANNNTWTGTNAFNTSIPTSTLTPTLTNQLCNKTYVDTKGGLTLNNTWTRPNTFSDSILIQTSLGSSINAPLKVIDSTASNRGIHVLPSATVSAYGPITAANDIVLLGTSSAVNTSTMNITTWSQTNTGLKITPTSVRLGAGGTSSTPSTSIYCDNSGMVLTTSTPPTCSAAQPVPTDSSNKIPTTSWVQNAIMNANVLTSNNTWTGTNNFTQNPTYSGSTPNINDSSTKIATTEWIQSVLYNRVPRPINYEVFCPISSDTSGGVIILFSHPSSWSPEDYFMIRVRSQINGLNNDTTPYNWTNYSAVSGEIIVRPYFQPASSWGTGTSYQYWPSNSGAQFNNIQEYLYTTGVILNGANNFIAYGSPGKLHLAARNPARSSGLTNYPFSYTCFVEYFSVHTSIFGAATITMSGENKYTPHINYL